MTLGQSFWETWPLRSLSPEHARAAGDEALSELDLGHLQREEGDGLAALDGDVLGDVGDQRRLSHRRAGGER